MKIAIVLNTSWNIYNFRLGLVQALLNEGHEVIAIAPWDEYTQKLIMLGCQYENVKMDYLGVNPIKDISLIYKLYKIYKRQKPDVILQYTIKPNIYGSFAASILKIPVINNISGLGTVLLNTNIISKSAIAMYKLAFRYPSLVFFQNNDDKEFFIKSNIIKKTKTDVLPGSGIDINRFTPGEKTNKESPFTFLLISRLLHDKGILEYIDAIKLLKLKGIDARFQLLGQVDTKHPRGISKELVEQWIEQGVVDYLGTVDDVRPFINNSDCVVLPSYREGTPRSLLEAASSGKPIITTDVAGCNNVVEHGVNGFLCESKNAQDLADKMEKMITQDKDSLKNMSEASRRIAETRFNEKIVINKYLASIAKI